MSKIINSIKPNCKITSNSTKPRSGSFEVTINNNEKFSKLKTNCFPQKKQIEGWFKDD